MTDYGLYDTISSVEEQRVKDLVYDNFILRESLNFNDILSEYCDLETNLENDTNDEFITSSFVITLSNEYFLNQNYYILIRYYDLNNGIISNEVSNDLLVEKEVKLETGANTIVLNSNYACFLQKDFDLIIKK